jgi:peptidoglycan hydrolase-like protein with peptidoglycan-binding domain
MLPLVVNDDPRNLVQVNQNASVGAGGVNRPDDVRLVQALINAIPVSQGGPAKTLVVDGLVGPLTINAIRGFQTRQLGFADGRVDTGQKTIRRLVALSQQLGSMPRNQAGLVAPAPAVTAGLRSAQNNLRGGPGFLPSSSSKWRLATTSGVSVSISIVGVAGGFLHVIQDPQPTVVYELAFGGVGVGLSSMPAGLDLFFADLPSIGTRILQVKATKLPLNKPDDFLGQCLIVSATSSAGPGMGGTIVLFNMGLTAYAGVAGLHIGVSGLGITAIMGAIAGWR